MYKSVFERLRLRAGSKMPGPQEIRRQQLLDQYDTFLFDADGVLWLGEVPIEGAAEALNQLVALNKRLILISNNSTKSLTQFVQKVMKLGFTCFNESNIVNAALVTAHVLAQNPKRLELPVYLCGTPALAEVLEKAGVHAIGFGSDPVEQYTQGSFVMDVDVKQKVFAVVTSFDAYFNYIKLMKAVNYLKDNEVLFYATNEDLTFPGSVPGVTVPGAGWTSTAIGAVANRQPSVMGKPHTQMFDFIHKRFKIDPARTLMVGDRLDTDILFGNRNKIDTMLVLTGVHSLDDVSKAKSEAKAELLPCYFAPSIRIFSDKTE